MKDLAELQTTPDISVVVPIYNKGRYLAQCLASVLSQKGVELEVICIDDASTDSSLDVVAQFEQDSRVRLLRNSTNIGPGLSRNMGIQSARGRYLQFTDADDLLLPNALERLLSAANRTNAEAVQGVIQMLRGGEVIDCPSPRRIRSRLRDVVRQLLRGSGAPYIMERVGTFAALPDLWIPWFHYAFLISRELLTRARALYPPLRIGEDPVFLAKVLTSASRICVTGQITYALRLDDDRKIQDDVTSLYVKDYIEHALLVKEIYGEKNAKAWIAYREFIIPGIRLLLSRARYDDNKTHDDLERRIAAL